MKYYFTFVFLFIGFVLAGQAKIIAEDKVYNESIKSDLLYRYQGGPNNKAHLNPPIIQLLGNESLVLEFDDLSSQYANYHVKILPYTHNWLPLAINEVEYISEYNDFIIQDYKLSYSTKTAYYHYRFILPKLKVAGNFLVVVYKERNKNDVVLTKRFMINAAKAQVGGKVQFSSNNLDRKYKQQINFEVNYKGLIIQNPKTDIKVVVRQNYRWDKTLTQLLPQFDKAGEQVLDYNFYSGETDMDAGNEYRFFDLRSLRTGMMGIRHIAHENDGYLVSLLFDRPQGHRNYVFVDDFDGRYVLGHYENGNVEIEGDYAQVKFQLQEIELQDNEEVYVLGAFNKWQLQPESKLRLNTEHNQYECEILLKQGIYNYQYAILNTTLNTISTKKTEGNHSITQNTYEIFVYHKPFGSRTDQLVGYQELRFNNR